MEHQEETLEQLFQCLLKLFENEMVHGSPGSLLGRMDATNGILNSQSSFFNSKHNISGLDSIGMSFGRATDEGHHQGFRAGLVGQNTAMVNMGR